MGRMRKIFALLETDSRIGLIALFTVTLGYSKFTAITPIIQDKKKENGLDVGPNHSNRSLQSFLSMYLLDIKSSHVSLLICYKNVLFLSSNCPCVRGYVCTCACALPVLNNVYYFYSQTFLRFYHLVSTAVDTRVSILLKRHCFYLC